jgi:lipid II:glycine glycyltransferase (peptidoglycan interpeptide bridge formation enzyme)
MTYTQINDRHPWQAALLDLPAPHVLQSWDWGEVKRRHGWSPTRLLWQEGEHPIATAQVLRRPLPYTPWGILYVPKGPILDYAQEAHVARVLGDLEAFARQARAILIKVDPDTDLPQVLQALERRGWRYSEEQIQFRNTALLDLTPAEDDLLMSMKSKSRYNVRLAYRRGVEVRAGDSSEIPLFYQMYAETGERDGFLIRPLAYYRDAWETFLEAGLAHMLLAEVEGQTVAGLILFRFGETAWYMYGASTSEHRKRMPNYALQWEAIRWAKEAGCTCYDMWGAPDALDEDDPLWGVWRFKDGLGATFAPHLGAYDYPARRILYWAFAVALSRYRALLRRRHAAGGGPS